MDEKQLEKETKQNKQENERYREELQSRDRATHSTDRSWEYDHKTGTLKDRKK